MGCEGERSLSVRRPRKYLVPVPAFRITVQKGPLVMDLINNGQDWRSAVRAREFTINIPINIKLGDDDEPEVTTPDTTNIVRDVAVVKHEEPAQEPQDDQDDDGTMVPPLQQQIELQKAALGKTSEVIDDLTDEDEIDQEEEEDDEDPKQFVDLSSFWNQKPVGN